VLSRLSLVWIACLEATITGHDHVTILEADAGVFSGAEIRITAVTSKADEIAGQRDTIALGDAASTLDVPAGTLVVTRRSCLAC
jgi:hypothetical protein